ncbi:hypothetical protein POKO110462_23260 [Pontibacter korlensis]|uniref:Uncharacterized protein n=1 Tax=Pontibacter korlensis TaxID=400092 RepID=A0A0E3UW27_9BACT|nr:hypothetical protein [Pontibacter korlensis]AKD02356.1 hypothetical protein PKOR_03435 [Pontibacter korlensis]
MKTLKPVAIGALLFLMLLANPVLGQSAYKGLPLLKANSSKVNVRVGSVLVNGLWTIKPEYNPNSLHIQVSGQKERLIFYTDIDSATYEIRPAESKKFYVLLSNKHYVLTEVKGFKMESNEAAQREEKFLNIEKPKSKTFGSLWEKHHVGEVVEDINKYADKASGAVSWVKGKLLSGD